MNNVDRAVIQDKLIQQTLDDMDLNTLMSVCYDFMNESYDKYSDTELVEEVKEYYPEILED